MYFRIISSTSKHILKPTLKKKTKEQKKQEYQIEKRSKTPTASPIVTFLRRPPIQSCANKIIINISNHRFPINDDSPFRSSISSFSTQCAANNNEAEAWQIQPPQKLNPITHFQNQPNSRSLWYLSLYSCIIWHLSKQWKWRVSWERERERVTCHA